MWRQCPDLNQIYFLKASLSPHQKCPHWKCPPLTLHQFDCCFNFFSSSGTDFASYAILLWVRNICFLLCICFVSSQIYLVWEWEKNRLWKNYCTRWCLAYNVRQQSLLLLTYIFSLSFFISAFIFTHWLFMATHILSKFIFNKWYHFNKFQFPAHSHSWPLIAVQSILADKSAQYSLSEYFYCLFGFETHLVWYDLTPFPPATLSTANASGALKPPGPIVRRGTKGQNRASIFFYLKNKNQSSMDWTVGQLTPLNNN